eukprot:SAG11_NODE_404_length_9736_cov_20.243022_3_plen_65_part_00
MLSCHLGRSYEYVVENLAVRKLDGVNGCIDSGCIEGHPIQTVHLYSDFLPPSGAYFCCTFTIVR